MGPHFDDESFSDDSFSDNLYQTMFMPPGTNGSSNQSLITQPSATKPVGELPWYHSEPVGSNANVLGLKNLIDPSSWSFWSISSLIQW
jgi:hypothetical protein